MDATKTEAQGTQDSPSTTVQRILKELLDPNQPKTPEWTAAVLDSLIVWAQIVAEGSSETVHLSSPVVVVADLQGSLAEFLSWTTAEPKLGVHMTEPSPGEECPTLVILGNGVGRDSQSLHCLILLMCLFVQRPHRVCWVQGRHEDEQMGRMFGMYDFLKRGVPEFLLYFKGIFRFFSYLPLVAIVDGVCLTNSGISPEGIPRLSNRSEIEMMHGGRLDLNLQGWDDNRCGVSMDFGMKPLKNWLKKINCFGFVNTGAEENSYTTNLVFTPSPSELQHRSKEDPFYFSFLSSTKHVGVEWHKCCILMIEKGQDPGSVVLTAHTRLCNMPNSSERLSAILNLSA